MSTLATLHFLSRPRKSTHPKGRKQQGNLIQGEGSDSLKTALETRGKTA